MHRRRMDPSPAGWVSRRGMLRLEFEARLVNSSWNLPFILLADESKTNRLSGGMQWRISAAAHSRKVGACWLAAAIRRRAYACAGLDGVRGAVREPSPSALHCAWTWLRRQNAGPGGASAGSSERACEDDWILTHLLHTADSSPRAQVNRRARVGAQAATLAALHGDRGSCSARRRPGGRAAAGRGRRGHAAQARCRSVPRMWPAARAA